MYRKHMHYFAAAESGLLALAIVDDQLQRAWLFLLMSSTEKKLACKPNLNNMSLIDHSLQIQSGMYVNSRDHCIYKRFGIATW